MQFIECNIEQNLATTF